MPWGEGPYITQLWIPFRPNAAVSAHAVMEANGSEETNNQTIIKTKQFTVGTNRKLLFVNGPSAVSSGAVGSCTMAMGHPVYAIADTAIAAGAMCGPTDSSWGLTTGRPGFVALAAASGGIVPVIRIPEVTIVRGLCTGNVSNGASTFTIDGVYSITGLTAVASDAATLTITHNSGLPALNNSPSLAVWNGANSRWEELITGLGINTC